MDQSASKAERPSFGLLVMTHGGLAYEFVRALEMIVGPVEHVRALSIGWDDDPQQARATIQDALKEVDPGGGVLILTDMFGGTATNLTLSLLREGVEVVTGVNLPMLIKFANLAAAVALKEAASLIKEQGQKSIALANEYLEPKKDEAGNPGDPPGG
jgi:PTS system mannose-specific IIA component